MTDTFLSRLATDHLGDRWELCCLSDHTWAIRKNGCPFGEWGAGEERACVCAFGRCIAASDAVRCLLLAVCTGMAAGTPDGPALCAANCRRVWLTCPRARRQAGRPDNF